MFVVGIRLVVTECLITKKTHGFSKVIPLAPLEIKFRLFKKEIEKEKSKEKRKGSELVICIPRYVNPLQSICKIIASTIEKCCMEIKLILN